MSLTGKGWRNGAADFLTGIADLDALATGLKNGTITSAQFARIAAAVLNTRAIATTAPLTGGGDLSADRTFAISAASGGAAGSLSAADFAKLATVPAGVGLFYWTYSQVIDLTTTGVYPLFPACPFRLRIITTSWELKSVGGTRSVVPTLSAGTNSPNFDNNNASQAGNAALLTGAAETAATGLTGINPNPWLDLTAAGLQMNVTAPATGAGIVLTARYILSGGLVPV